MGVKLICDADGVTELTEETAVRSNWGVERVYGEKAAEDVDAYWEDLQKAAEEARAVFVDMRAFAKEKFHSKYPNGKLPDDDDE
jgi:hypothetical protein